MKLLYLPPLHVPDGSFICVINAFYFFIGHQKPFDRLYGFVLLFFFPLIDNSCFLRAFQMFNLVQNTWTFFFKTVMPYLQYRFAFLHSGAGIAWNHGFYPAHARFCADCVKYFLIFAVFQFCTIRIRNACPLLSASSNNSSDFSQPYRLRGRIPVNVYT